MNKRKFSVLFWGGFSLLSAAVLAIVIDSLSLREKYKRIEPNLDNYSMAEMLYLSLEKARNALVMGDDFDLHRKVFSGRLNVIVTRTENNESYRSDPVFIAALSKLQSKVDEGAAITDAFEQHKLTKLEALAYLDELEEGVLDIQEAIYTIQIKNFKNIQHYIELTGTMLNVLVGISFFCIMFLMVFVMRYSYSIQNVIRKKNIFISSIYHELSGAVQAISMATDMISEDNSQPELIDEINLINFYCNKILEQTKEVMEYSRFEIGEVEVKRDLVNFKSLIDDAVDSLQWKKNKIKIFSSNVDCLYVVDKYKTYRVIVNLLDNANKFTNNGVVVLNARHRSGWIYIKVKDNGDGFDIKKLKSLYEPFRSGSEKKAKQGMGLGLAIIKNNTDVMKGIIRVNSSIGRGTVFLLRLPVLLDKE